MIKSTESARVGAGLGMPRESMLRSRRAVETRVAAVKSVGSMKSPGMTEVVTVDEDSAVGYVAVVVEHDPVVMPVVSPMSPTPAKPAEEANSKAKPPCKSWAREV
jgi:hypothetical protein